MSAAGKAQNAYKTSTDVTATSSGVEYQALCRLNSALGVSEKKKTQDRISYIQALGKNLEFWTIVGVDAASEESPLPTQLRAQLFYLYEFTQHHTMKLYRGDEALTVDPLVEINNNIMNGLKGITAEQIA